MAGDYISADERELCRKVAKAFEGAFVEEDTLVLDAGRFGFVKLRYYKLPGGFESVKTFRSSEAMFRDLWDEWVCQQILEYASGTPLVELEYAEIFRCIPEEIKESYGLKKQEFMSKAGCSF